MPPYPGKRALDLLGAGGALAVLAPVVAAVAVVAWFEDGRPPLFLQTRLGSARRPFTIVKLRSMRAHQVTRVGLWLRRTGIDELPQFLNVCRGQMSIVGPRPLTAADVERLGWGDPRLDWRFSIRPGITGLSQLLAGRGAKLSRRLDRLYVRRQSLALDLRIVALSFAANVIGKPAVRRLLRARHALRSVDLRGQNAAR